MRSGWNGLEVFELLAGTHEEDRLADDLLDRERGAATGVAVDLGEHDTVETDRFVERGRDVHRFLTGHRVDDEQRVVRLHDVAHLAQLVHQRGVDLQSTGRVDDHDVLAQARGFVVHAACDRDDIAAPFGHFVVGRGEHRDVDPPAQHAELLDRGRALKVGGDEQARRDPDS